MRYDLTDSNMSKIAYALKQGESIFNQLLSDNFILNSKFFNAEKSRLLNGILNYTIYNEFIQDEEIAVYKTFQGFGKTTTLIDVNQFLLDIAKVNTRGSLPQTSKYRKQRATDCKNNIYNSQFSLFKKENYDHREPRIYAILCYVWNKNNQKIEYAELTIPDENIKNGTFFKELELENLAFNNVGSDKFERKQTKLKKEIMVMIENSDESKHG